MLAWSECHFKGSAYHPSWAHSLGQHSRLEWVLGCQSQKLLCPLVVPPMATLTATIPEGAEIEYRQKQDGKQGIYCEIVWEDTKQVGIRQ